MSDTVFTAFDRIVELPETEWSRLVNAAFPLDSDRRNELANMLKSWKSEPDFRISTVQLQRAISGIETSVRQYDSNPEVQGIEIHEKLGGGASGTVYRGRQTGRIKREIAVKVFHSQVDGAAHLKREAEALARLVHPNIATLYEVGVCKDGRVYAALEYVRGCVLTDYITQADISVSEVLELFGQICDAVAHANEFGVIHRDLKPANILVTELNGKPVAKVLDFSISRSVSEEIERTITEASVVLGTPEYMSPEQANPDLGQCTTRSDVFSLGVILYEILASTHPYVPRDAQRPSIYSILECIRVSDPMLASRAKKQHDKSRKHSRQTDWGAVHLRGDLDAIIQKAMLRDPADRYPTARQLQNDILRHVAHEPIEAKADSWFRKIVKSCRRHPIIASTSATAITSLVCLIAVFVMAYQREQQATIRESRAHAQTRMALVSSALSSGDLSRAQQQLTEIPTAYRSSTWEILAAYCDQSESSLLLDSQGIVDIWQTGTVAYVAGGSGKVWRVNTLGGSLDPILVADRSRVVRGVAGAHDSKSLYVMSDGSIEIWCGSRLSESIDLHGINTADYQMSLLEEDLVQLIHSDGTCIRVSRDSGEWHIEEDVECHTPDQVRLLHNIRVADDDSIELWNANVAIAKLRGHTRHPVVPLNINLSDTNRLLSGDSLGYIKLWDLPRALVRSIDANLRPIQINSRGIVLADARSLYYPPSSVKVEVGVHQASSVWNMTGSNGGMLLQANGARGIAWDSKVYGPSYTPVALSSEPIFRPALDNNDWAWIGDGSSNLCRIDLISGKSDYIELPAKPITATFPAINGLYTVCAAMLYLIDGGEYELITQDLPIGTQFIAASTEHIVTSTNSGVGTLIEVRSGSKRSIRFGNAVHAIELLPDHRLIAVGQGDGSLVLYDLINGQEMASLPIFDCPVAEIMCGSDGVLRLLSAQQQVQWLDLKQHN